MFDRIKDFFSSVGAGIYKVFDIARKVMVTLIFMVAGLVFIFSMQGGLPVHVPEGGALALSINGAMVEYQELDRGQLITLDLMGKRAPNTVLADVLDTIDYAAHDPRISMISLHLDSMGAIGLAQLQEIGAALDRFKAQGKPVYAFGRDFSQPAYYLAARADKIVMDPEGFVDVKGLASYQHYFAKALDRFNINITAVRAGEYKAAVEPYILDEMSEQARADVEAYITDLWATYTADVDTARGFEPGTTQTYAVNLVDNYEAAGGDAAKLALEAGLVDEIMTVREYRKTVAEITGWRRKSQTSFRHVSDDRYLRQARARSAGVDFPMVGILVAQGEIRDGEAPVSQTGGRTLAKAIARATADPSVKAIVIRVNSPGGSVTGSEEIRREIARAREEGKPVVVSMSNVAASGGYWIATAADAIYAQPGTVTGSIGAFGLFTTFERIMGEYGVSLHGVETTPNAALGRWDMAPSPDYLRLLQASINRVYRDFTSKVSEARDLPLDTIDAVANGRVWSGVDAMQMGLVDEFGGLREAVKHAAQLAQLERYRSDILPLSKSFSASYLDGFSAVKAWAGQALGMPSPEVAALLDRARQIADPMTRLAWMNDPRNLYSHCMCETVLEP